MIGNDLFEKIKLNGVTSGLIEIIYGSSGFIPVIALFFYDEETGVDYLLDLIILGEFAPTRESYMVGEFDVLHIKNSIEAELVKMLLLEKGRVMGSEIVSKAKEFAKEIRARASIRVKVIPRIHGKPEVIVRYEQNIWHTEQLLEGGSAENIV